MKPPTVKRLTSVVVLIALCSAFLVQTHVTVRSAPATLISSKLSPDLRAAMQTNAGAKVRVIVQSTPGSTGLVGSLLQTVGGLLVSLLPNLNIRIADIQANSAALLAADPSVSYVSLDAEVRTTGHIVSTSGAEQVRPKNATLGFDSTLDGSGVTIAVLDSGIDANHRSFSSRAGKIAFSKDFTGESRTDDPYGHGTHVAAIAAGEGSPTQGAYEGIAPGAKLVNLRVLDSQGVGKVSSVLAALDWLVANRSSYNIKVVNMSLGTPAISSFEDDPICKAVKKLVDSGVVVVAAAGNNGKNAAGAKIYGAIHCPGNSPAVITVGASNSYGTDSRIDDSVTSYSSRGPTRSYSVDEYGRKHYDNLIKPDLVAPGNKIIAAEATSNKLVNEFPSLETNKYSTANMKLMYLSGTSMSTPVVAGAAALLLESNSKLTPNLVKMILTYTAQPLAGANTLEQGTGQLNIAGGVALAKLVKGDLLLGL
ncbi:MAG TPA: S8 family peptidase, partial [Pyrinomonadaceae bacterium]